MPINEILGHADNGNMRLTISTLACVGALLVAFATYPGAILAGATGSLAAVLAVIAYCGARLLLSNGAFFEWLASSGKESRSQRLA